MHRAKAAFRFIDLFAGLGGFHVALRDLGGEGVFAAEWEPTLNALYAENFGLAAWMDINDLKSARVIDAEIPDHDVLAAGFPCQPFSKAGEQLGFEHTLQGHLFFQVLEILRVKRPRRFILENVPNILYHRGGQTRETIVAKLGGLGYQVKFDRLSPHQFGVPQVRERAYFVGSVDGLDRFEWPEKHKEPTDITTVIRRDIENPRAIPKPTLRAIDMWGDFLRRAPESTKLPSFPIWSMEFGATYPYVDETPQAIWKKRKSRGLSGLGYRGNFGFELDDLSIAEQYEMLPSHSRRAGDFEFPHWKQMFIRQNREFYTENRKWINPWLQKWKPWEFYSSFQKFEWNAQGEERNIDKYVLQVRASGVRVKRTSTAPSLIAMTQTQIPILGAEIAGHRRYMTSEECAKLQSLDVITLPAHDLAAYRALGNAVNAHVVRAIAVPLLDGLNKPAKTKKRKRVA
ncbi:DNA (cytosine-5-)-methyltransferase [Mycolicibacterium peregrinum]|uniref:Cytosine-specific methyltransferase n=1 Tax=Mycolicibacterium peregrinum TaxID=43304 RepID=A0A1A0QUZ0_MYCPR|nr:DNA (cytosine-5-)-methyltransferase [Mycolicibacterium peregrinum]OBB25334.1 DNA (cytosine-5-)-methyltransferase [Mycolicibacterium peregrinum]